MVLCGLGGKGICGLGVGLELPLLKGWFFVKGRGCGGLKVGLAFFCCSTL